MPSVQPGAVSTLLNPTSDVPAAPTGFRNARVQASAPYPDPNDLSRTVRDLSFCFPEIAGVNKQTGDSYEIQESDNGLLIVFQNNSSPISAVAATLPQVNASPLVLDSTFRCLALNLGVLPVTITPDVSTINGKANVVLGQGDSCLIYLDSAEACYYAIPILLSAALPVANDPLSLSGNTLSFSGSAFPFAVALPNVKYIGKFTNITANGDTDIYTVPANRRAIFYVSTVYNNSGNQAVLYAETKIGGTYYRLGANTTVNNGSIGNWNTAQYWVAEAGTTLSVNSTQHPLNVWTQIIEFDDTAALKTSYITRAINGANTIYTVPVGKSALFPGVTYNFPGGVTVITSTGSGVVITHYAVPSGSSPGTTNQLAAAATTTNLSPQTVTGPATLNAQDSIVVNSGSPISAAGQFIAWVTVIEH
jgi:hypothetical protein